MFFSSLNSLFIFIFITFFGLSGCGPAEFLIQQETGGNGSLGVDDETPFDSEDSGGAGTTPIISALDQLREDGSPNANNDISNPIDSIRQLCAERPRKTRRVTINFPTPSQSCQWTVDDNLEPRNFFFQARSEQVVGIDMEDAVFCDMSFELQPEAFFYDDQVILSLNDTVLTSSYDYSQSLTPGANGLTLYNWSSIAGSNWQIDRTTPYCANLEDASPNSEARCVLPESSANGVVDLSFHEDHIMTAMANGVPRNSSHFFRLTTIGDNDITDCSHAGLRFDVSIEYVE